MERQAKRFYYLIDSLRTSIIHEFNMVTMLYSSSVQIRVSTRDLMKEKNGSVRTTSQRVGGLVTDCPVLGGDGRVSDQRGSLLGVGRDGGTQRCGHIGVF